MKDLEEVVEDAEIAFWASVARSFPEAVAGDLEPDTVCFLHSFMRSAVKRWVELNVPEKEYQHDRKYLQGLQPPAFDA